MASLLDRINQIQAPQQKNIQNIMDIKSTGKALTQVGPKQSSLGEEAAIGAVKQAAEEQSFAGRLEDLQLRSKEQIQQEQQALAEKGLAQQGQIAQAGLQSDINARRQALQAQAEEARLSRQSAEQLTTSKLAANAEKTLRDNAALRNMSLDDIFSQFRAENVELEARRDASQLEQTAFTLAMQDKSYLSEIEKIGQLRQLQNQINFKQETDRLVFGNNLKNLLSDIKFNTAQDAKSRQYSEQIAQIDPNTALQIAIQAGKDNMTRAQWEAGGEVLKTGIQYATREENK